jgi:hypothetical protein
VRDSLTATDGTSQLPVVGALSLRPYLGKNATHQPVTFTFDDFVVTSAP